MANHKIEISSSARIIPVNPAFTSKKAAKNHDLDVAAAINASFAELEEALAASSSATPVNSAQVEKVATTVQTQVAKMVEGFSKATPEQVAVLSKADNGGDDLKNAVLLAAQMMSQMQVQLLKGTSNKQILDTAIANSLTVRYQNDAKASVAAAKKAAAAAKKAKIWGWVSKVATVVVGAVACCFGQVEIAVAMGAMLLLTTTGAMDKMVEGLGSAVHSKTLASVLIAAVIVAAVVAAMVATGGAAAAPIAAEGAAEGTAAAAEAGEGAASSAQPSIAKAAVVVGGQAVASTNMITNVVEDYAAHHTMSDKKKAILEGITAALQIVVALASAFYGMSGISEANSLASKLGAGEKIMRAAPQMMAAGEITSGIASVGSGTDYVKAGQALKDLAPIERSLVELENIMNMLAMSGKGTNAQMKEIARSTADTGRSVEGMTAGMRAEADVLGSF